MEFSDYANLLEHYHLLLVIYMGQTRHIIYCAVIKHKIDQAVLEIIDVHYLGGLKLDRNIFLLLPSEIFTTMASALITSVTFK